MTTQNSRNYEKMAYANIEAAINAAISAKDFNHAKHLVDILAYISSVIPYKTVFRMNETEINELKFEQGGIITAIKSMRERCQKETGQYLGLKEAKDIVDAYIRDNGLVKSKDTPNYR